MIHDLKPYPAYKDSGVPWLGDVPEHWEVVPISRIGQLFKGNGGNKEDEVPSGVPCVRYGELYTRYEFFIRSTKACVAADRAASYTPIQYGDVLFAASGETIEDIGRSAVNLLNEAACCGGDILLLRPEVTVNPIFLGYVADAAPSKHQKGGMGRGFTVVHIYASQLKRLMISLPPLSEQSAIVRYIDYMDHRIRHYIHAKQKLIKLLEEQKQAIIHRAVTRGLDPNVKLKPSGVEWLGDVPEHWEVILNQRIFKEKIRPHGGQAETQLSLSQRAGLIATSDMQERSMQTSTYDNWKVTIPGDLVLNRFKAHLGVFFSSTIRGIVSFHYGVFEPRSPLITKYFELLYHTNVYRTIYAGRSNGMTVGLQNLSNQNFYNVRSIVPPIEEQKKIVSFVEMATNHIDEAISTTRKEITLYSEYRTRVIADVVTGKLDVREEAASLPDEVEEPEVLEDEESTEVDSEGEPEENIGED